MAYMKERYFIPENASDPIGPVVGPILHDYQRIVPYHTNTWQQPKWINEEYRKQNRRILNYSAVAGQSPPSMLASPVYLDPRLFKVRTRYAQDVYPESETYGKYL